MNATRASVWKMWLDRFSGHSTPSQSPPPPVNRNHPPGPARRPSQLGPGLPQRPGYGPRTSSLNPGSRANNSTTSVNSQRLHNGSTLKHEVTPPADFSDSLEILEKIVGRRLPQDDKTSVFPDASATLEKPLELLVDVDFDGLSLEDFAHQATSKSKIYSEVDNLNTSQTVEECECVCAISSLFSSS